MKLERPIGGVVTELGELHVRPVMAGYGYTRVYSRYSITADARRLRHRLDELSDGNGGVPRTLGVGAPKPRRGNTFVLKPEIGVWYDFTRKLYLNVNAGYMFARPDVEIVTPPIDNRTARADQFILKVGIVYSLF